MSYNMEDPWKYANWKKWTMFYLLLDIHHFTWLPAHAY